jgi:hypothetical protein
VGVLCTEKWGMLKISKKTILALEVTEEQKETI